VIPPIAVALGLRAPGPRLAGGDWTIATPPPSTGQIALALLAYAIAQAILFAAVALIVAIPAVRRALTPRFLKRPAACACRRAPVRRHLGPRHGQRQPAC